jgi:hypothetical protein
MSKNKDFRYVVPTVREHEFPEVIKQEGAVISCRICPDNEVEIIGNSKGLIYLTEYLAAMALLDKHNGLHVHLDPEIEQLDAGSATISIYNLNFGTGLDKIEELKS